MLCEIIMDKSCSESLVDAVVKGCGRVNSG